MLVNGYYELLNNVEHMSHGQNNSPKTNFEGRG